MSVRFSLRFAGRSWERLLGVANCDEPGRESVVAIMAVVVVCGLQCCRAVFPKHSHGALSCVTLNAVAASYTNPQTSAPQIVGEHASDLETTIAHYCLRNTYPTLQHTHTTTNMVLKLRLARPATPGGSRKHHPRYNIVLAHARYAAQASLSTI